MTEKKDKRTKRNVKEELAARYYADPQSESYLNKTQSLIKAGYSESYANCYPKKISEMIDFTDILPDGVKTPQEDLRNWQNLAEKARIELQNEPKLIDKGSKFLAEINKMIELKTKHYGLRQPEVTRTESVQYIDIPRQICKKCGNLMDYMKEGEGRTEAQEREKN